LVHEAAAAGGAGTTNNGTGTLAAALPAGDPPRGRRVVFVRAGTITGTGTINANGRGRQ
jgi:hypothetical protein